MTKDVCAISISSHTRSKNTCCCRLGSARNSIVKCNINCLSCRQTPGALITQRDAAPRNLLTFIFLPVKPTPKTVVYTLPSMPIQNTCLQNTVKQRLPFCRWMQTIFLYQFHHGILHNIQRILTIASGKLRHRKSTAFNITQKSLYIRSNNQALPAKEFLN